MLKRILSFDKQDWKHIAFLFKNMIKQFFKGDIQESKEAFIWIKTHLSYDSERVD